MTVTTKARRLAPIRVERGEAMYGYLVPDGSEPFIMWFRHGTAETVTPIQVTPHELMPKMTSSYVKRIPETLFINDEPTALALSPVFKAHKIQLQYKAFPKTQYPAAREQLQSSLIQKVLPQGLDKFDLENAVTGVLQVARAPWSPGEVRLRFEHAGVPWAYVRLFKDDHERSVLLRWTAPDGPQQLLLHLGVGTLGALTTVLPRVEVSRPLTLSDMNGFYEAFYNLLMSANHGHPAEMSLEDTRDDEIRLVDSDLSLVDDSSASDSPTQFLEYRDAADFDDDDTMQFEVKLRGSDAACTVEALPSLTLAELLQAIRKAFKWEFDRSSLLCANGKGWPQLEFRETEFRPQLEYGQPECHYLGNLDLRVKDTMEYILGGGRRTIVHDTRYVARGVKVPKATYPRVSDVRGLSTRGKQFGE